LKPHPSVRTILIIEENANIANLVRAAFDKLDSCDAFVCRNNSEAKAYLLGAGMYKDRAKYPFPRAIVSDPGVNDNPGLDLLRWIKTTATAPTSRFTSSSPGPMRTKPRPNTSAPPKSSKSPPPTKNSRTSSATSQ